ncbi:hypothetical protein OCH239_09920 [Roseivivax halodurans JCM 10272]|uniref:ParB-like N-terminal domain-containing protein n=1 Tax=Roseivivax halodurans JCM 10272 TaxID=1449350 RepID=X7EEF6_9RHOB|nr:ParB N-terminal domain-containing protein [Roseivivax halodurans]ETX13498.1 hypothetical protein OCH239_09920 [Roseivivax halodurans JCM 10272]
MAKRKRLTPANPDFLEPAGAEAKSLFARPAPIADVARDASSAAALEEMAETLATAREEGRMVLTLSLDEIETGYLVRDRIAVDEGEMQVLKDSLRARGQQAPVEVAELEQGTDGTPRYGLISGWRRCRALSELHAETGEDRFARVLALLRRPCEASDAYLAMVEENEIRVGLSYYERARVVARAVEQGVFETKRDALRALFHAASRAKRSKIGSFLALVEALDGALRFPETIGERQGLALAKAMDADPEFGPGLRSQLETAGVGSAEAEQGLISSALLPGKNTKPARKAAQSSRVAAPAGKGTELRPGLWYQTESSGGITLSGPAMTSELRESLMNWLKKTG